MELIMMLNEIKNILEKNNVQVLSVENNLEECGNISYVLKFPVKNSFLNPCLVPTVFELLITPEADECCDGFEQYEWFFVNEDTNVHKTLPELFETVNNNFSSSQFSSYIRQLSQLHEIMANIESDLLDLDFDDNED